MALTYSLKELRDMALEIMSSKQYEKDTNVEICGSCGSIITKSTGLFGGDYSCSCDNDR